jgi:hypothetical protein
MRYGSSESWLISVELKVRSAKHEAVMRKDWDDAQQVGIKLANDVPFDKVLRKR